MSFWLACFFGFSPCQYWNIGSYSVECARRTEMLYSPQYVRKTEMLHSPLVSMSICTRVHTDTQYLQFYRSHAAIGHSQFVTESWLLDPSYLAQHSSWRRKSLRSKPALTLAPLADPACTELIPRVCVMITQLLPSDCSNSKLKNQKEVEVYKKAATQMGRIGYVG